MRKNSNPISLKIKAFGISAEAEGVFAVAALFALFGLYFIFRYLGVL